MTIDPFGIEASQTRDLIEADERITRLREAVAAVLEQNSHAYPCDGVVCGCWKGQLRQAVTVAECEHDWQHISPKVGEGEWCPKCGKLRAA
jgi:hypothetical protein